MKPTAYWISTLLSAGLLFIGGLLFITKGEHQVEEMKHLGYPVYFLIFLGIGRILGVNRYRKTTLPTPERVGLRGFCLRSYRCVCVTCLGKRQPCSNCFTINLSCIDNSILGTTPTES